MRVKRRDLFLAGILAGLSFAVACVGAKAFEPEMEDAGGAYIIDAEWISTTDTSSYFRTGDGFLRPVQEAHPEYDDRPYLLTMSDNETPCDRSDDTILVVWAAQ